MKPHLPFVAPKKYWDFYRRDSFSLPSNLGVPEGYPDYASNVMAGELRSYSDIPEKIMPAKFPAELNRRLIHGYHACASYMDSNVGLLLDALKKSGADKNTIVVFWADHGWKLGDHSSWCKHTNFEVDARVLLLIRHPEMESAKGTTKFFVELIDLYPTLCDLAGLKKATHLQGKSLLPVLKNPDAPHRKFAYSSYAHGRGRNLAGVVGHSIRTERFGYSQWWEKESDKVVGSILTDLENDPGETKALGKMEDLKADLASMLRGKVLGMRKK